MIERLPLAVNSRVGRRRQQATIPLRRRRPRPQMCRS